MRRSLLTANVAPAALTPIGRDPATGTNLSSSTSFLTWTDLAAVETGTITQVTADFASVAGNTDIAFFTIDSSNVVRDMTGTMTALVGVNNYAVTLAVQSGDRIGIRRLTNSSGLGLRTKTYGGAGTWYRYTTTGTLAIGNTRNPTNTGTTGDGCALLAIGTQ